MYVLQICYLKKIFYAYGRGVSLYGRWRLPREVFNDFVFPVPPLSIQREISSFLDGKIEYIQKKMKLIERKIELLEEYRKSLIHHVVTGKVDVRGIEA